jgi:hypothetical protein
VVLQVELRAEFVAAVQVLPRGVGGSVEEETGIARVFDVKVDLAAEQRPAHHRRCAERRAVRGLDAVRLEQQPDHLADHRGLARELRGDHDGLCRGRR